MSWYFESTRLTIRNSLIALNSCTTNGGGIYITHGILENCTIVSNYAGVSGGGLYIDGPAHGTNNIVYFNWTGGTAPNFTNTTGDTGLDYSCVTPAVGGNGNITADPQFVAKETGNFRLAANSPCINTGSNENWMTNAVDLDGRMRIRYGTVDMGAYELLRSGTIFGFR